MASMASRTAALILGGALLRLSAADHNPATQIAAEIQRIEQAWKSVGALPSGMDGVAASSRSALTGATEALSAGMTYLALERLVQAEDLYQGARAVAEQTAAMQGGMPAFESEWGKVSLGLAALSREVQAKNWTGVPAGMRAIAETSLGRSVPLLDGARGFATATGPKDGLFYLGEAQAQAEFARFCASLDMAVKRRRLPARSLLPELMALQAKADAAFRPPRSIEQHSRFIALNSTLKLARELDSTKAYFGALYQYLEAVRHFGMLDAATVTADRQAVLIAAIEAERRKAAASSRDDSILQLFLERAAVQAKHPDGSTPTADEWRSAQVIVSQVVPAYAAVWKAAPPIRESKGKIIDVTLVRWPYT